MSELAKTAVVTGGSRGIGKAVAERLAADGYRVFLTYVSRPEEAEAVVKGIEEAGGAARAFRVDVSDGSQVADFFKNEIKDKVDLAALVNNAGMTKDGPLLRMKDEDFERVLDVNLSGAFTCLREAAKIMSKRRAGRIVNVSSVVGLMGNAFQANYVSSKAGLIGLTKSAARELAPRNVTVNAVAPGFIETDMTADLPEKIVEDFIARIPLGRAGGPAEVAGAVSFLLSEDAAYLTGQVISVNGGMYM